MTSYSSDHDLTCPTNCLMTSCSTIESHLATGPKHLPLDLHLPKTKHPTNSPLHMFSTDRCESMDPVLLGSSKLLHGLPVFRLLPGRVYLLLWLLLPQHCSNQLSPHCCREMPKKKRTSQVPLPRKSPGISSEQSLVEESHQSSEQLLLQ